MWHSDGTRASRCSPRAGSPHFLQAGQRAGCPLAQRPAPVPARLPAATAPPAKRMRTCTFHPRAAASTISV